MNTSGRYIEPPKKISALGQEILRQKEERFAVQRALLARHGSPLLSVSLRLPGELLPSPEGRALLDKAASLITALPHFEQARETHIAPAKWQVTALPGETFHLKLAAVELEEQSPVGLFLDLDIIGSDGRPVSRKKLNLPPRPCILCGSPAKVCHREGIHPRTAVNEAFFQHLEDYFLGHSAGRAARLAGETAVAAALLEVSAHPKPGLVTSRGCGSHQDMDLGTFILSSTALTEIFTALYSAGEKCRCPERLFVQARAIGACGERKMLRATRGVNTQKGFIFVMGLILTALGALGGEAREVDLRRLIQNMTQDLVKIDLERERTHSSEALSAGEKAYHNHGIDGVRGEAESGFATIFETALPAARTALAGGASLNDVALQALLAAITRAEDTALVKRGGIAALHLAQERAAAILTAGGVFTELGRAGLAELERTFSQLGLSPGGAADLAAAALFFILRDNKYQPRLWNR